ncbi:MAG TPA: hypothetical protein VFU44_04150 [Candidatus Limnocylindria bacterium]|jgi:hypothetical protein|nr:hypothetical protein [Candidatus Limnocylindria bacterium]
MTPHRVVVLPWLRLVGRFLIDNWLAITIGRTVFAWRPLNDVELEHELEHVRQWRRYGVAFPVVYLAAALRARRAGRSWYRDNRFEEDARKAASSIKKR